MSLRILLANSAYHPRLLGGAEFAVWSLARALSARGHHVNVLATTARRDEGPREELLERESEELSGRVYEASAGGWQDLEMREGERRPGLLRRGGHHFTQIHDRRWQRLTHAALLASRAQILHTNTLVGLSLSPWRAACELGIPVVHTTHDVFLLCPRTTLLRSDESICAGGPVPCQVLRGLKHTRTSAVRAVTAPSRFTLNRHRGFGFFNDVEGHVIPSALEADPPAYRSLADGPPRGVFLGALAAYKGVELLCETLESLLDEHHRGDSNANPKWTFDFAGAGPLQERVEELCARSAGRIRYHGRVHGEDKSRLLHQASFVVIPSLCEESFGRAALDAFAHGRPVIATARGALPEVVTGGETGWIVAPRVDELRAAIVEACTDAYEVTRRGRVAYDHLDRFTLARQASDFESVYFAALSS